MPLSIRAIEARIDTKLSDLLAHIQYTGGFRLKFLEEYLVNYSLDVNSEYIWLSVAGIGKVYSERSFFTGGDDILSVGHKIYCDGNRVKLGANAYDLDYYGLGSVGVHNLGTRCVIVRVWDTTTPKFEARSFYSNVYFRETLVAKIRNASTSNSSTVTHSVDYYLFVSSINVLSLVDEPINSKDFKYFVDLKCAPDFVSSIVYRLKNVVDPANVKDENARRMLFDDSLNQLLLEKKGEGLYHVLEFYINDHRYTNVKEILEILEKIRKEFNLEILEVEPNILKRV